jgi:JAB domain-containing protein similar to deubiquitination enzymes
MTAKRFTSADFTFSVELSSSAETALRRPAAKSQRRETGGILIGKYSPDQRTAFIMRVEGPPPDSRAGSTWFVRGVRGLQRVLRRCWARGEYYLGEWHYHPGAPNPSTTDLKQLMAIATSVAYCCPEPLLCVVGSRGDLRWFVTPRGEEEIELHTLSVGIDA